MHPSLSSREEVSAIINTHSNARFVHFDCAEWLADEVEMKVNQSCIVTQHDEIGFLAGVTAAQLTVADHVAIVVGVDLPWMHPFQTGFEEGVAYVDPSIRVSSIYLTRELDWSGFASPTLAFIATNSLVADGADVVFSAAGESYWDVLDSAIVSSHECCLERESGVAAESAARADRKVWTIAVDVDWHQQVRQTDGWVRRGRNEPVRGPVTSEAPQHREDPIHPS